MSTAPTPQQHYLLLGLVHAGENSKSLRESMLGLRNINRVNQQSQKLLKTISKKRQIAYPILCNQFQTYLQLSDSAIERSRKNNRQIHDLDTRLHPRFMGSRTQLRSGYVVGSTFGIDTVFGAMLNPTGGLVGPGNKGFDFGDSPLSYHSVVHDAAGYLWNFHGIGTGYDYLQCESTRDTNSSLTGQSSGIKHWYSLMETKGFCPIVGMCIGKVQDMKQKSIMGRRQVQL